MATAVSRYSRITLVAAIVMAATGVINAALRVRIEDLFTVTYGGTVLPKFVLTVVLAAFGFYHRQKTIPQISAAGGSARLFARVAIVETVFMAAIMGVATSMGRTPPPPPRDIRLSPMILEMGYEVTKAPTLWNVWTVWRFDLMFATFALGITSLYIWGVLRLRAKGEQWPWQRTAWFLVGSIGLVNRPGLVRRYDVTQEELHGYQPPTTRRPVSGRCACTPRSSLTALHPSCATQEKKPLAGAFTLRSQLGACVLEL